MFAEKQYLWDIRRKTKLNQRAKKKLKKPVTQNRENIGTKVIAGNNVHIQQTVRRDFHKQQIYGRATTLKPIVSQMNAKQRLQWWYELTFVEC